MISVVIPTLNSEATLVKTLAGLVPATVEGVVREVVVADGGSTDRTFDCVEDAGARWLPCPGPSRGAQLHAGAEVARGPWLLFLHADTQLQAGWEAGARKFMREVETRAADPAAAVFEFQLDDQGIAPRILEAVVGVRTRVFKFPYGDQGLLISKQLYQQVGGYRPLELMEDVDLIRRIGRKRLHVLRDHAITSAARYRENGYLRRILRNQLCLALYYLNVSPHRLAKVYSPEQPVKVRQT